MNQEFTAEEIKDAVRMARVYCPGFSDEQFESLMELGRRISDSGYLEVVRGLLRLEEEKGISCTEAIDSCEKLLEQKKKLAQKVPELEKTVEFLSVQLKQTQETITCARQELKQIRSDYADAKRKLEALNRRMETEKQLIEKRIEECRRQANVTTEEVVAAGRIKADVESHGFTIELMADLSKEFAGQKEAREKLAEALLKHGSLNKYLDDLADWEVKERARLMAEIAGLESQKKALAGESGNLRKVLSQLQADIAGEKELRRFYRRYVGMSILMEHLAGWNEVFFMRCLHPVYEVTVSIDATASNARFWTDKRPLMCPQCGYRGIVYDETIYQALNWPVGAPLKLNLGE